MEIDILKDMIEIADSLDVTEDMDYLNKLKRYRLEVYNLNPKR